jgi:VIT1/CCC1 family predicted Fe2+/Mn2+ transporter
MAFGPQIVRFAAGTIVYNEGDRGDHACLVKSGEVEIFQMRDGSRVEIARAKAGQMFGELELVDGSNRMADARAMTNVELEIIPRAAFLSELLGLDPKIHSTLLDLIDFVRTTSPLAPGDAGDGKSAEMAAFLRGVSFGQGLAEVKSPFTRTISELLLYYAGRRVPH